MEAGKPWRKILEVADEIHADLVVVGAHVDGRFGRAFLGSTANQVLRHAGCPVLVARELQARGRREAARHEREVASSGVTNEN